MNLLQPYLPRGGQTSPGGPYSESGALYALGLIHANKGGKGDSAVISFLTDALRNSGVNGIVQHGACLGIGLAAMATGDEVPYRAAPHRSWPELLAYFLFLMFSFPIFFPYFPFFLIYFLSLSQLVYIYIFLHLSLVLSLFLYFSHSYAGIVRESEWHRNAD